MKTVLGFCVSAGLDRAALARECGLTDGQMADPDRRLPARQMRALWRAAVRASGDPAFALRVATQSHPAMYGLVGHLATISRDVGEVLGHLCRYQRLLSDDGFWTFRRSGSRLVLIFDLEVPADDDVWRQGVELSLANAIGALRFLTGRPVRPLVAGFVYRDPGCREVYERVFGCPLRFGAADNRLEFEAAVAELPVLTASPALAPATSRQAEAALHALEDGRPTTAAVGRALAALVPAGHASLEAVAETLVLSGRTLARRLATEGTSFRRLLDDTRFEMAEAWLARRDLGIEEIAFRLGYADFTGFHRAFRKRAGCSPGEFRRRKAAP